MRVLLAAAVLGLAVTVPASAGATLEQIEDAYRDVIRRVPCIEEEDYFPMETEPRTYAAIIKARLLILDWAMRYLDAHPNASAAELGESFARLTPDPRCQKHMEWWRVSARAEALSGGGGPAFAVTANYGTIGAFFVVARRAHGFAVVWSGPDFYDLVEPRTEARRPFAPWGYGDQRRWIHALPPTGAGESRFYVLAEGFAPHGCCGGQHLSLWQWDGVTLRNLLSKSYRLSRCDDEPGWGHHDNISLRGDLLEVRIQGSVVVGSSCGDPNPRAVWRIELGPESVRDLGEEWVDRDLQFVEDVLVRSLRNEDVGRLIEPSAAEELRAALGPKAHWYDGRPYLGMGAFFAHEAGEKAKIGQLVTEGWEATFFIVERDGKPYVKAVDVHERR